MNENEIVDATTIADVYRADKQLAGIVKKTRLIASDFFSELSGNEVFLKPENMQRTGAYKVRVKLTAPASKNYEKAKAKTVTLTVKVK